MKNNIHSILRKENITKLSQCFLGNTARSFLTLFSCFHNLMLSNIVETGSFFDTWN